MGVPQRRTMDFGLLGTTILPQGAALVRFPHCPPHNLPRTHPFLLIQVAVAMYSGYPPNNTKVEQTMSRWPMPHHHTTQQPPHSHNAQYHPSKHTSTHTHPHTRSLTSSTSPTTPIHIINTIYNIHRQRQQQQTTTHPSTPSTTPIDNDQQTTIYNHTTSSTPPTSPTSPPPTTNNIIIINTINIHQHHQPHPSTSSTSIHITIPHPSTSINIHLQHPSTSSTPINIIYNIHEYHQFYQQRPLTSSTSSTTSINIHEHPKTSINIIDNININKQHPPPPSGPHLLSTSKFA